MHRFFTYDETIREHHLFSPEVYVENPDERAGVALYLEGLGYDITMASVGLGKYQKLSWERIEMNDVLSILRLGQICIGRITDGRYEPGYREKVIEALKEHCERDRYIEADGERIDLNPVSCGDDVNLFKALALYRDDTDIGKLIFYKDPPEEWYENTRKARSARESDRLWTNCQWDDFEKDCNVGWVRERCIMLHTLEDVLKYKDYLR